MVSQVFKKCWLMSISIKANSSIFNSTTVIKPIQNIVGDGTVALSLCKPPKPVSFTGNAACNWRGFEEQLTWFLAGTESSEKSDSVKIGIMLTHAGKKAHRIYKMNLTTK